MTSTLPSALDALDWTWPEFEPHYAELQARNVAA